MKKFALAIALMLGGTAFAQTAGTAGSGDMSGQVSAGAANAQPASGPGTAGYTSQSSTDSSTATSTTNGTTMSGQTQTGWNATSGATTMAMNSTGAVVQPSNASPRRDRRGIPVISLPAVVPAGWNGVAGTGTGMGGPLVDPATGQPVSD